MDGQGSYQMFQLFCVLSVLSPKHQGGSDKRPENTGDNYAKFGSISKTFLHFEMVLCFSCII